MTGFNFRAQCHIFAMKFGAVRPVKELKPDRTRFYGSLRVRVCAAYTSKNLGRIDSYTKTVPKVFDGCSSRGDHKLILRLARNNILLQDASPTDSLQPTAKISIILYHDHIIMIILVFLLYL